MTARQQEARDLKETGLTQREIAERMGIKQSRVSTLLDMNRRLYEGIVRYRKTDRGKETARRNARTWSRANPEKARAISRAYKANPANHEKIRQRHARWAKTEKGRECLRRASRKFYRKNSAKIIQANAEYQKTAAGRALHNRAAREWSRRRRAEEKHREVSRATPAQEQRKMNNQLVNRQAVLLNGAAIGFVFDDVPFLMKKPPGPGPFEQVPAGFSTPEIGSLEGLWWKVTPFNAEPWKALSPAVAPPENPLLAEFWGHPIPLRATSTMTRPQAVAREQARQQSIEDTESISVFPIPEELQEFYTETGLGTRAILAKLPHGNQVRFTQGQLGIVHDNADTKPELVDQGHPTVFGDYQMKVVRQIAETEDLSLANLRDKDGNEVLDAGGNPIPITWMPTVAPKFLEVKNDILGGS